MNWLLVLVAATGVIAGPVVAGVVAPSLMTQVAEVGVAMKHRHFVFDESFTVHDQDQEYTVHVANGDLYELPLTTQVVLRGSVEPPPPDAALQMALQKATQRYGLPVLSHDVQRDGAQITLKATLPAGVLANLSPKYQRLVEAYEQPS